VAALRRRRRIPVLLLSPNAAPVGPAVNWPPPAVQMRPLSPLNCSDPSDVSLLRFGQFAFPVALRSGSPLHFCRAAASPCKSTEHRGHSTTHTHTYRAAARQERGSSLNYDECIPWQLASIHLTLSAFLSPFARSQPQTDASSDLLFSFQSAP
jgi:hypothetical protein